MADAVVTPASVKLSSSNPALRKFIMSGAAIIAGQSLSRTAAGKAALYDSDAAAPANTLIGIAVCSAPGVDQPMWYTDADDDFTPGFAATQGIVYVGSDTAGGIAPVADLDTGDSVNVVGTGKANGHIALQIDATGQVSL